MHDENFTKFIFEKGKKYYPGALPEGVKRGPTGQCFDVSLWNAIRNPGLRYVEGLARDPRKPDRWVLHAWLTDGETAFDPTWRQETPFGSLPILTDYIGVEIDTKKIGRFVLATEYKSVFSNGWREPAIAAECVPGYTFEKISREFFIELV